MLNRSVRGTISDYKFARNSCRVCAGTYSGEFIRAGWHYRDQHLSRVATIRLLLCKHPIAEK